MKYLDLLKVTGQGVQVKLGDTKHTGFFYKGELKNAPVLHNDVEIDNLYVYPEEDMLTIILKGDDLLCQQIYMNLF